MSISMKFPLRSKRKAIGGLGVVVLVIIVVAALAYFGMFGLSL